MASEIRNRFTDTEMQIARETDLPELLSHLGYQVQRVGRFHTTAEMDSLRIKDRHTWFRYSQNTGGDAITFLQQFCGKSFPEAMEYLLTFHGKARDAPAPEPKPISQKRALSLPPRNGDDRRVFAYLRKRGIAAQVIRQFLNAGLLYEDAVHHNCVFVGRNESGQAKYAGLRGTYDLDGPGFKGDAPGSSTTGTVRPFGLDCSGMVDWVFYNQSGGRYVIGHGGGATAQHSYCTPIDWSDARPGDLVFYPEDSHVGIVCGFDSSSNVLIIHCASGYNNVVVTGKSGFTVIGRPQYYGE